MKHRKKDQSQNPIWTPVTLIPEHCEHHTVCRPWVADRNHPPNLAVPAAKVTQLLITD